MASLPLKYHGGKQYLAAWIVEHFPEPSSYVTYCEPYFGGGSVLFAKPEEHVVDHSEVVNDLNRELTNFWRVLQSEESFDVFARCVQFTPFSDIEFSDTQASPSGHWRIDEAIRFFVRYRQSRQGLGKDFATLSKTRTRRGMNEQVSSWLSAIDGLPEAHDRLHCVAITCRPAIKVIRQLDCREAFFYLDPPYLHTTRVTTDDYDLEMSYEDHQELLKVLSSIKGKFLLSGYRSDLYDAYAANNGWTRVEREIDCKASSKSTKDKRVECLWRNC